MRVSKKIIKSKKLEKSNDEKVYSLPVPLWHLFLRNKTFNVFHMILLTC